MKRERSAVRVRNQAMTDALGAVLFALLLLSAAAVTDLVDAESGTRDRISNGIVDHDRTVVEHKNSPV